MFSSDDHSPLAELTDKNCYMKKTWPFLMCDHTVNYTLVK